MRLFKCNNLPEHCWGQKIYEATFPTDSSKQTWERLKKKTFFFGKRHDCENLNEVLMFRQKLPYVTVIFPFFKQKRREREMQQQVLLQDEETVELRETYTSLQQEVEMKTKKLKKVRKKVRTNLILYLLRFPLKKWNTIVSFGSIEVIAVLLKLP